MTVEVTSFEDETSDIGPGYPIRDVVLEPVTFTVAMLDTGSGTPSPTWQFVGRVDTNPFDDEDTDKLRLLMELGLGAKHLEIRSRTEDAIAITAWFRNKK